MEKNILRFSRDFQNKILGYRRWQDAQLSLIGRLLLEHGLQELGQSVDPIKDLSFNSYHKPRLDNNTTKFNISHSGNITVCAINEGFEIGIDIEMVHNINIQDFKDQMTSNEWNLIMNSRNRKTAFFDYWTQKEAVVKACGLGLEIPLRSFEIINTNTYVNKRKFYVKEINLDKGYKCHVAMNNKVDTKLDIQRIEFSKGQTIWMIRNGSFNSV